jgi:hypothetical protein
MRQGGGTGTGETKMMTRTFLRLALLGSVALGSAILPATAEQTAPKPQTAQPAPAQPARPVYVPPKVQPSPSGQLKAAAQGPGTAAKVFDGGRVNTPAPVHVQPSTTTVNAATIAAQQNAAEKARQAAASRKLQLDSHPVPPPGSR